MRLKNCFRILATGVALLAAPVALHAQTFPTADPVIKRLYALGMDSSHTKQLAHSLLDSIGPRLTGSPDLDAADDWVVKTFTSWGIDAKKEPYGTWRGWRRGFSHIDLLSPRRHTLDGTMLGYSPGTGAKDLDATTMILPRFASSADFVNWLPQVKGKLVLVDPPEESCRPPSDWKEFATPASDSAMAKERADVALDFQSRQRLSGLSLALGGGSLAIKLEEAGAAAIVTSRPKLVAWGTREIYETYTTVAPTISLSCEDYGLVFRLTETGDKPVLRLNLDAELLGERPVYNAIGTIRGTTLPNEYVVLSAHLDSWDGSSGATDNGAGSLMMIEAMRILKLAYPKPKRTIIAGLWAGEEEGLIGSMAWAFDHPEVRDGMQASFNQDGGTGRVTTLHGAGMARAVDYIPVWISKLPTQFQAQLKPILPGEPDPGYTDDASFACWGLPAFGFGGIGWSYAVTTHTDKDSYDKLVFDDLKYNATVVAMMAYLASEEATKIPRDRAVLPLKAGSRPGANGGAAWPSCPAPVRSSKARLR